MTGPEKKIEQYLCMAVTAVGGIHRKIEYVGQRGCPDRLVAFKATGYHALVEVKAPGQKPRPEQEREHETLREHGVRVEVVSTTDEVDALIVRAMA